MPLIFVHLHFATQKVLKTGMGRRRESPGAKRDSPCVSSKSPCAEIENHGVAHPPIIRGPFAKNAAWLWCGLLLGNLLSFETIPYFFCGRTFGCPILRLTSSSFENQPVTCSLLNAPLPTKAFVSSFDFSSLYGNPFGFARRLRALPLEQDFIARLERTLSWKRLFSHGRLVAGNHLDQPNHICEDPFQGQPGCEQVKGGGGVF